jgi:hypothetical protein
MPSASLVSRFDGSNGFRFAIPATDSSSRGLTTRSTAYLDAHIAFAHQQDSLMLE